MVNDSDVFKGASVNLTTSEKKIIFDFFDIKSAADMKKELDLLEVGGDKKIKNEYKNNKDLIKNAIKKEAKVNVEGIQKILNELKRDTELSVKDKGTLSGGIVAARQCNDKLFEFIEDDKNRNLYPDPFAELWNTYLALLKSRYGAFSIYKKYKDKSGSDRA